MVGELSPEKPHFRVENQYDVGNIRVKSTHHPEAHHNKEHHNTESEYASVPTIECVDPEEHVD